MLTSRTRYRWGRFENVAKNLRIKMKTIVSISINCRCNQNMWGTEPLGRDLSSLIAFLVFFFFKASSNIKPLRSQSECQYFIVIFSGWEAWGENNNGTWDTIVYIHMITQNLLNLDFAVTVTSTIFPHLPIICHLWQLNAEWVLLHC